MRELSQLNTAETRALSQRLSARINLVFFDIDGTLVDSSISVPEGVIRQIKRLKAGGVKLAIASGRPYFAARYFTNDLSLDSPGLFCTGAVLFEPKSQRLIKQHILLKHDLYQLIEVARRLDLHCELYTDSDYYIERQTQYSQYHADYLKQPASIRSFNSLLESAANITKALVAYHGTKERQKISQMQAALPHLIYAHGHGADRPEVNFTSIVSPQANKQMAFEQLCAENSVSADQVLSVGDGDSDVSFITQAGVGIAMGNAKDEVKRHSDYICDSVDSGGLEQVLSLLST